LEAIPTGKAPKVRNAQLVMLAVSMTLFFPTVGVVSRTAVDIQWNIDINIR